jgi:hypothetical protein
MEHVMPTPCAALLPLGPPVAARSVCAQGGAPPVLVAEASHRPPSRIYLLYLLLLLFLLVPGLCVVGVASYFHLSSSSKALRGAVMESVPGQWHNRFAMNVGYLTFGLVRLGSQFFNLPPEAKAAFQALNRGEVGVYQLDERMPHPDCALILKTADHAMRRRGWERILGVAQDGQFVAVYAPHNLRVKDMSCCVAVLSGQDLVIVSTGGNVSPLLELAQRRLHDNRPFPINF